MCMHACICVVVCVCVYECVRVCVCYSALHSLVISASDFLLLFLFVVVSII